MFVTHLECSLTGKRYPADRLHNLSRAGKPLLVRYDLEAVRAVLDAGTLAAAVSAEADGAAWMARQAARATIEIELRNIQVIRGSESGAAA